MHRSPSLHQIADTQTQLLKDFPLTQAISFPCEPSGGDMFEWVSNLAFFCFRSKIKHHGVGDLDKLASCTSHMVLAASCVSEWLCHRHAELSLFRFLQSATNHARDNSEGQKEFIYSLLFILMLSRSRKSDASPEQEARSELSEAEFADFLDRKRRVRTALWIYSSVCIGKLPSWTNFWEHLPKQLELLRGNTPDSLRNSLEGFDLDLIVALHTHSNKKVAFLRHAFPFLGEHNSDNGLKCSQGPSKDLVWRQLRKDVLRSLTENVDTVHNGILLADVVEEYVGDGARKILAPQSQDERDTAAQVFFGTLISIANSPTIRSDSPFRIYQEMNPSRKFVESSLLRFRRRIPGLPPYQCSTEVSTTRRDKTQGWDLTASKELAFVLGPIKPDGTRDPAYCFDHSARFLELANLFGEAAFFIGVNTEVPQLIFGLESAVKQKSDDKFQNLKLLLSSNSSWLTASCGKLNGLFQALLQISDRGDEVGRIRAFQRLLRRKLRDAFGHLIVEASQPSPETKQMALLLWRTFLICIWKFSGLSEVQENVQKLLWLSVAKVSEQVYEGRYTLCNELALPQQFGRILEEIQSEFMSRYPEHLISGSTSDFDTKMDIMEQRISKVMASLNHWYSELQDGTPDLSPVPAKLRKPFEDLFVD
ncbi:hypothetical protein EDB81DRAFT_950570 [Dactylonectria macrodidyma]|uniref:Uncharacterized protein n=1 Tax=Dactylonectria macrodidyma TaxID=307937 RepID=A0A9P9E768_9HYPO|nr:hypothetical protein EDB81DRAFT_950570 [Dactylonectria macrodidyma]